MAEVDFSNAKIAPAGTKNTTSYAKLNMDNEKLFNSSFVQINSNASISMLTNQQKRLAYLYSGTFTASGTEFLVSRQNSDAYWRISNISFQSGDTYMFKIRADLICQ